ncbi:MAG TPA: tetraacyldisaccharide 4'-kinase [Longimicrobiales bacterium]|nr:tetraacyldisaccharide 4'-kinase [Longimicrobiales bacterium]
MRARPLRELTSRWWSGELGAGGAALDVLTLPLERVYAAAVAARNRRYDDGREVTRVPVPVISVGNLAVGGSGKTPVAAWLVRTLQERGRRPALLHGGYAADEPALHRMWLPGVPVLAQRDRVAAARTAIAAGADVLVLDDGFQHRRLARDVDLVLVAAERWTARPRLLPRGPWREGPAALRRASLVAITRRTADPARSARVAAELGAWTDAPVLGLRLDPAGWTRDGNPAIAPEGWALAVAGVADPTAVAANARAAGAQVHDLLAFPDHHEYGAADARRILAAAVQGRIVTTEKDWIKLQRLLPADSVWVLRQHVQLESGAAALDAALTQALA